MPAKKTIEAPVEVPVEVPVEAPVEIAPARGYTLRKQFMQKVQGNKEHPTWAGVLDALHQLGLQSIQTDIVQIPTEENGNTAITKARITLNDGSFYEAVGLADPTNVPNKMIAKHLLHMAETRSKGRAGRDATNISEALLEELEAPVKTAAQQIAILWSGSDVTRKTRVRQYLVDHLHELEGEYELNSLADLMSLPESYLVKALAS